MDPIEQFNIEKLENIATQSNNKEILMLVGELLQKLNNLKYSYNFTWLGRPIIQYPQDIIAMQEIIWKSQPDLIIETGIAHGGSLIFYASMLELIGKGEILGIDIDIRHHNRVEIEKHPMFKRITMFEGSSISEKMQEKVYNFTKGKGKIMVVLDSNHTHTHVLEELRLYSKLVSKDCYLVVFDTVIENLAKMGVEFSDRPWGLGNNPKTAVQEFLKNNDKFVVDKHIENKLLMTVAPEGFLKKIK